MIRIPRRLSASLLAFCLTAGLLSGCSGGGNKDAGSAAAGAQGRSLYASATAAEGGDGSRAAPFNSLQALELASEPGDTLVILPSPVEAPALDGGIGLKPGQRLIGGGPDVLQPAGQAAVAGAAGLAQLPRIRNSSIARFNGDAVRLAPNSRVENLVISGAVRGAVYGQNVPGATVVGNDISGFNTSCMIGFTVEPFPAPSSYPMGAVPLLLPAGWAAIMIDANTGAGSIEISGNYVHDNACGNGIDVRMSGDADYTAEISQNFITHLEHGPLHQTEEIHLVHAITLQSTDTARLEAESTHNTQTYIGSPHADCEGLFLNIADSGTAIWNVEHNYFAHGIGGFSCNGMEFIISNGNGYGEMSIRNSHFEDNPGDMLEQANLGSGSTAILELDHVVAKDTHERGGDPAQGPLPFNIGECLLTGSTGTNNRTILKISNTEFSGCNNGLSVLSGANLTTNLLGILTTQTLPENPLGPDALIDVEISNSRFVNNDGNNLVLGIIYGLQELNFKVEHSDFSTAGTDAVAMREIYLGDVQDAKLDFGGGDLSSGGGNCFFSATDADVLSEGFTASFKNNWWGQPGGPNESQVSESAPELINADLPLAQAPAICGE